MKKVSLLLFLLLSISAGVYGQSDARILLAGYKEVPPVPTPASGTVFLKLENDTLKVEGTFSKLASTYWSAGIYYGKDGRRGNMILRLKPTLEEDYTSGSFLPEENSFHLNNYQKEVLRRGELYISISTYKYQQGEIRANIPSMRVRSER